MWRKFDENARKVIFYAQEEAEEAATTEVLPEQILLGVLTARQRESVAQKALRLLGIDVNALYGMLKASGEPTRPKYSIDRSFSLSAKNLVNQAYGESQLLGNCHVGPEHLLLGAIQGATEDVQRILERYGISLDPVREAVKQVQSPPISESGRLQYTVQALIRQHGWEKVRQAVEENKLAE